MTAAIQNLNLLGGLVTATVVKADVTASGNPPSLGDHSSFVGLSVAGQPGIGDNVPVNTKVPLAGLGTLWLHRVVQTGTSIRVIMIQLDVTVPSNPLGLTPAPWSTSPRHRWRQLAASGAGASAPHGGRAGPDGPALPWRGRRAPVLDGCGVARKP